MHYISQKYIFRSGQSRGCAAALGCFDGVHKGHLSILQAAKELAHSRGLSAAVISFEEPPAFTLHPGSGLMLTDLETRTELFRRAGMDAVYYLRFEDVRNMGAEEFINSVLRAELGVSAVACGYNFTFGKDRSGTPETLLQAFGGACLVCPQIEEKGETVSSSLIRRLIGEGDTDKAADFLGRSYSLSARAEPGRHDGTRIGFPTANLHPAPGLAVPAPGVYIVKAAVECEGVYPALADAGFAPTLDKSGIYRIEVHLLDFCRELYGKKISVSFLKHLRPEMHFDTVEGLKTAISGDISSARAYFSQHPVNENEK